MKKIKNNLGFIILLSAFVLTASFSIYNMTLLTFDSAGFSNSAVKASVVDSLSDGAQVAFLSDSEKNKVKEVLIEPSKDLCDPFCMTVEENPVNSYLFEDMDDTHRYAYVVNKFYEMGILKGYDDGTFRTDANLNRAEFLTVIVNVLDVDFSGLVLDNCFLDVKDEWFSPFICYAKNKSWVKGYEGNTFRPVNDVTRAEALKMAMAAFNYEVLEDAGFEYLDVDLNAWYMPYLYSASNSNLISKNGRVGMSDPITRGEFMQLLYNAMYFKGSF